MINHNKICEFIRFCIVGTIALAIQYLSFYFFLMHLENHNLSYISSYVLSAAFNFILTVCYTFNVKFSRCKFWGFIACRIINAVLQLILYNCFLWMGMSKVLAPFPVYCLAVPTNFILVRFVMTHRDNAR